MSLAKKRRLQGTWIRCSSSDASLCILCPPPHHRQSLTLVVSVCETVYEEHYVYQLNFTWPQVSSPPDCHIRGSRVIFASYSDSMGQLQKFAMQFSSFAEAQMFMESMKCFQEEVKVESYSGMTSNLCHHRIFEEPNYVASAAEWARQWQPSIHQERHPYSCSQSPQAKLSHAATVIDCTLPQSFTALLSDCCTDTEPGVAEAPVGPDLNHFLNVGCMADYSFIAMLHKIDRIITFLGGDLSM